jgi:hypothetical protein
MAFFDLLCLADPEPAEFPGDFVCRVRWHGEACRAQQGTCAGNDVSNSLGLHLPIPFAR